MKTTNINSLQVHRSKYTFVAETNPRNRLSFTRSAHNISNWASYAKRLRAYKRIRPKKNIVLSGNINDIKYNINKSVIGNIPQWQSSKVLQIYHRIPSIDTVWWGVQRCTYKGFTLVSVLIFFVFDLKRFVTTENNWPNVPEKETSLLRCVNSSNSRNRTITFFIQKRNYSICSKRTECILCYGVKTFTQNKRKVFKWF